MIYGRRKKINTEYRQVASTTLLIYLLFSPTHCKREGLWKANILFYY